MNKMSKYIVKIMRIFLVLFVVLAIVTASINAYICYIGKKNITTLDEYSDHADCVIVLGAGVSYNQPSYMLRDRLDLAIELYDQGRVDKILVSGDHGSKEYDEVNVMKEYLLEKGIKSEDIFMDHAGFDTYSTMVRAKKVFEVESCIISTQEYHLCRGIYLAMKQDIDAKGIPCDNYISSKLPYFKLREIAARVKAFLYAEILKPEPVLGDVIPINGDGEITADGIT